MMYLNIFLWLVIFSQPANAEFHFPRVFEELPPKLANYFGCPGSKQCEFIYKHWRRDTVACTPDPEQVLEQSPSFTVGTRKAVIGQIRYLGIFAKKYHYTIDLLPDQTLVISSFIAIKNRQAFSAYEIANVQNYLDRAADIWEQDFREMQWRLRTPYNVKFRFKIVEPNKAFYKVRLVRGDSRGPYDTSWSLYWSHATLAHEMGHVMGLDDEYKNNPFGGDTRSCMQDSLMCRSHMGTPKDFHYYLILRRMSCNYNPMLLEQPFNLDWSPGEPDGVIE